jgi:HD-GYP domain-containing protein (c-di-GMP phosphodiesterase class II)
MSLRSVTKPLKREDRLRIGDVLDEALYGQPPGARQPTLLLAAGHRIESVVQLRRLQEAGFPVDMPRAEAPLAPEPAESDTSSTSRTGSPPSVRAAIQERSEAAMRVRQVITGAAREMMERIREGVAPDIDALESVGCALVSEVRVDAGTLAALTHLRRCDDYTVEHSVDVAILMVAVAQVLGLPEPELNAVAVAGLSHDVGKQRVPPAILHKPGRPTAEEFVELRRHPEYGFEILARCSHLHEAVGVVALQHHERLDGSGYPSSLQLEQIHPYSRIAAVADSFDAMTSDRIYRKGCTARQAVLELFSMADKGLDARAVQALIKLVGVYPVGTRVTLDTGERGTVIAANPEDTTRPVVLIDQDQDGRNVATPYALSLASGPHRVVAAGP